MQETKRVRAIVLRRLKYRENDSRITVYSFEKGLLELVVRGTARPKSKLVGHIEPFNLVDIMIVPGKNFDYAGSVSSEENFLNIKNNVERIETASQAVRFFLDHVRSGETDKDLFLLLLDFLLFLDTDIFSDNRLNFFLSIFKLKMMVILGHKPELHTCVLCREKIVEKKNAFNLSGGGLVCLDCMSEECLTISSNCIKILRLSIDNNISFLANIEEKGSLEKEVIRLIKTFCNYCN